MEERVIFFDGVCRLCNGSVNFVIRHNRDQTIKFATVQSKLGKRVLEEHGLSTDKFESMLYFEAGQPYEKSTAALKIAKRLSFPFNALQVFYLVPKTIRDWLYDQVARNRYKWFGKQETCLAPTKEVKDRFLDL